MDISESESEDDNTESSEDKYLSSFEVMFKMSEAQASCVGIGKPVMLEGNQRRTECTYIKIWMIGMYDLRD